jgi:ComEC/Rec2-related protein
MHLLAISGLHIGIILLLLRYLVAPLKKIRYGAVLSGVLPIVLLWCFALITGGSSSVIRAVTIFSFLQVGMALKRKNVRMQGVWVSFMVLLFVRPQLLFDVGFQLSYAVVFGIVWMMPHWQRIFIKKSPLVRYIATLIGLGGIAQLSVLPISLFYFHQFQQYYRLRSIEYKPLRNTYKDLLVVDSSGVYLGIGKQPSVLLRQSPKIHLEALIDSLSPQIIIADGSNYPSFVARWKKPVQAKEYASTQRQPKGLIP